MAFVGRTAQLRSERFLVELIMNSRLLLVVGFCLVAVLFCTLGAGVLATRAPGLTPEFQVFAVDIE